MVKRLSTRRRHLVKALRSGKYTQGKGCLELAVDTQDAPAGSNCCLGVACRVAIRDGLDLDVQERGCFVEFGGRTGTLPEAVLDWYGFAGGGGWYGDTSLVIHNDYDGYSFDQIADIIEAEPEGLFRS